MNLRFSCLKDILETKAHDAASISTHKPHFGHLTFSRDIIEKMLPKDVAKNIWNACLGKEKINPIYAEKIATAVKEWAVEEGATHFCHWFQPLSGCIAEKHDAFIDWDKNGKPIEKFSGKQLLRGEADASSFPSGGLRQTSAARGYMSWHPSGLPFIWKTSSRAVLCIPAVFFSKRGEALDMKIPLIRAEEKLKQAALRLTHILGMDVSSIHSTLGCEQEYFLIDQKWLSLRPDLVLAGRTLYGAPSAKMQDFQDHYFGCIQDRVLRFMEDFEDMAYALGVPVKTRHSEVAPQQFEIAPIFEPTLQAVDHNILLMQIMKQKAKQHGLVCLFHEKPFAGLNGSGKHCNWSLSTDAGCNLLDPALLTDYPLVYLSFVAAVLSGVYKHAALLRCSIASPGNDHRLGGHEAPPPIISISLGEELERFLEAVENEQESFYESEGTFDLRIPSLPDIPLDTIDRNRTSPFAYTGNKFEFRSVGSSAHPAVPLSILNSIVAESIHHIADRIECLMEEKKNLRQAVLQVIHEQLIFSKPIRFLGDNYSNAWNEEAKKRGLPRLDTSFHAYAMWTEVSAENPLDGVLSMQERLARRSVLTSQYAKTIDLESKLMLDIFYTQIVPAAMRFQREFQLGEGRHPKQKQWLAHIDLLIERAIERAEELKMESQKLKHGEPLLQASVACDTIQEKMRFLRELVDELEMAIPDALWPHPKYREMLFFL